MDWTPAQIARLTDLWIEGHSCAEIARRMFISKNAVIGKSHRLLLPKRPSPITSRLTDEEREARKAIVKPPRVKGATLAPLKSLALPTPYQRAAQEIRAAKPPKPALPKMLSDEPCCWPIGEPGQSGFRYCDAPVIVLGRSYCPAHHARSRVPTRRVA